MSKIRVWTIDGEWSKEFKGLDKIHLMKSAIEDACHICDKHGEYLEDPLNGFEFNANPIDADRLYDEDDSYRENPVWRRLQPALSSVETFKVPLYIIKAFASECNSLTPIYEELIDAAKVPSPAPEDNSLLFKFEDE